MDLVIMAAGMGSRFGGLKQIEPIDDNGNFIIDYTIYDAIRAGFEKVVFVIKRENLDIFRATVGKRIEKQIKVEYAFQDSNSFLPSNIDASARTKPWGTAHAILCARDKVDKNFAVVNADDYYGCSSLLKIFKFLSANTVENDFAMVGYKAINTISDNGSVKRGICEIQNGNLMGLTESAIEQKDGKLFAVEDATKIKRQIENDTLVSMNLFGFNKSLFDYLEKGFEKFLIKNQKDLSTCEYFIPTILSQYIADGLGNLKVVETDDRWFGLTYKQDFNLVKEGIQKLVKSGIYPSKLWG